MLFFRRFIHDILPAILVGLATLIFCLFSFAKGSASIAQRDTLSHATFSEMFYSEQPYSDPKTMEKSDTFADFAGVMFLKAGDYSMSSDTLMVLPSFRYSPASPFYTRQVETLQEGQCLVSKNVMALRHVKVGDTLFPSDRQAKPLTIIGELPPMKGFEHEHHGVIVMGYDAYMHSFLETASARYVTFSQNKIEDFGQIRVLDRVYYREEFIQKTSEDSVSRMFGACLTPLFAAALVGLLTMRDDIRKKAGLIACGARKKHIFLFFLGNKALVSFAPAVVTSFFFFISNLVYLPGALSLFLIISVSALLMAVLQATALLARS